MRKSLALLLAALAWLGASATISPAHAATLFAPGTVVVIRGTPHLFVSDADGRLHWAADPRAIEGRAVTPARFVVASLEEVMASPRGEPWVTLPILVDGTQIAVASATGEDTAPTLRIVGSVAELEAIGVDRENYGRLAVDRARWERLVGTDSSTLERSPLALLPARS